jgi:hypothetical protein
MKPGPLFVLALALSLAVACGGGAGSSSSGASSSDAGGAASTNTWVGKLADTDAFIAVMKEGTAHLIYITDGKELFVWFDGNASGAVAGYFTFYNDEGGSIINNPAGDGFGGTVTLGPGRHHKYSVTPARGDGGLYRAKETVGADTWESAWIVLNDGLVKGARRSAAGQVEGVATRGGTKWTNPAADP